MLRLSNAWKEEVLPEARRSKTALIFRRASGGGTVLQGPGCLNYSLILKIKESGASRDIRATNEYVMQRHRRAIETLTGKEIAVQGHTDLTINELKFSGNSQRRKRKWLLFHGTFLLDFDLSRIDRSLSIPAKQPAYRQNRSHSSFVANLEIPGSRVKKALNEIWDAKDSLQNVPRDRIKRLSEERYSKDEWNFKL